MPELLNVLILDDNPADAELLLITTQPLCLPSLASFQPCPSFRNKKGARERAPK
ncbi:MAG TPA: hypothetical protein G4N92_04605 [Anaerolineae bacterium]|nr:hypothetical protein [Anaerolineae bacterium]